MRRTLPISCLAIPMAWLVAGCSGVVSLGGGGGGGGSQVTTGQGGAGGTATTSASATTTTSASASASASTGGIPGCMLPGPPNADMDGDGFTPLQGDCNDCDPNINPNAVELPTLPGQTPVDENCDGVIDEDPAHCDANLAIDDGDPVHAAAAVELCKQSAGPNSWGLVSAKWVLPDGAAPPAAQQMAFDLGHGILHDFGPNVAVQHGSSLLALSSGTARRPTDPGYHDVAGYDKGYTSGSPMGFPKESPACPGVTTGQSHDGVGLEVSVRAPSNAHGFSFQFNFFTYEWPNFICSSFNDTFVSLLSPVPAGQMDGNISYDSMGNLVTVNNAFLQACACPPAGPACVAGGKTFLCSLGDTSLIGTGFGKDTGGTAHGSTSWLTTSAPISPGDVITLRWTQYDSGDGILDTTTLVDNWRWSATPTAVLTYRPMKP